VRFDDEKTTNYAGVGAADKKIKLTDLQSFFDSCVIIYAFWQGQK